jgi:3-dehydroquinate synthase
MLEYFEVSTSGSKYKVTVGKSLLPYIRQNKNAIVLVDEYLTPRLPRDIAKIISIPALESSKNLDCIPHVIEKLRNLGAGRDTHIYAIGGGVVQDIATFVSSIYMRGLLWTYFPSTLLSMADSCIGGKSSINVCSYKNLVGNIYPPVEVFVDIEFCQTLHAKEIIGGLAEAVKICYARGSSVFDDYLSLQPLFPISDEAAMVVVSMALRAKKWFVEIDEFDKSERLLLNYGHTFGHALEAASNFELAHGLAVALGMLVANQYAASAEVLTEVGKSQTRMLDNYLISLLSPCREELKNIISKLDLKNVLSKFESDKKHRYDTYKVVIPCGDGDLILHTCQKSQSSKFLIESAYKKAVAIHDL